MEFITGPTLDCKKSYKSGAGERAPLLRVLVSFPEDLHLIANKYGFRASEILCLFTWALHAHCTQAYIQKKKHSYM